MPQDFKVTTFDASYSQRLASGDTILGGSSGSNAGYLGGDVLGGPGDLSVVGLRSQVALSSNINGALGDVLTIISVSPRTATFATPSNSGTVSAGSNSTRVREISTAGASTTLWSPFDHAHDGIGTVTASSSNTMQRGTLNLRAGTNVAFGLTDTDGNGSFDTITVNSTATGGGAAASGTPTAVGCKVYATGNTTVPNATFTAVAFGGEEYDTDNFHSNVTNNTRLTIPAGKTGYYVVTGSVEWDSNTGGERIITIHKNSSEVTFTDRRQGLSPGGNTSSINTHLFLTAGDFVELKCYQDSTGNRTIDAVQSRTFFGVLLVGV